MTLQGPSEMTAEGRCFASLYIITIVCLSQIHPQQRPRKLDVDMRALT